MGIFQSCWSSEVPGELLLSSACLNLESSWLYKQTMDPRLTNILAESAVSQKKAPSWGVSKESPWCQDCVGHLPQPWRRFPAAGGGEILMMGVWGCAELEIQQACSREEGGSSKHASQTGLRLTGTSRLNKVEVIMGVTLAATDIYTGARRWPGLRGSFVEISASISWPHQQMVLWSCLGRKDLLIMSSLSVSRRELAFLTGKDGSPLTLPFCLADVIGAGKRAMWEERLSSQHRNSLIAQSRTTHAECQFLCAKSKCQFPSTKTSFGFTKRITILSKVATHLQLVADSRAGLLCSQCGLSP